MRRVIGLVIAASLVLAGCASGPSPAALARNEPPSTTTTTEPPPEGVVFVIINNGRFSPSNLSLQLADNWIVEWQHQDPPVQLADGTTRTREYQIISRDKKDDGSPLFESPVMQYGESFQVDFSEFPEDVYRYNTFVGAQRIPGLVDTRPSR